MPYRSFGMSKMFKKKKYNYRVVDAFSINLMYSIFGSHSPFVEILICFVITKIMFVYRYTGILQMGLKQEIYRTFTIAFSYIPVLVIYRHSVESKNKKLVGFNFCLMYTFFDGLKTF